MEQEVKNTADNDLFKLAVELENSRGEAMVNGAIKPLSQMLSNDLYYGHSSGYGDNKNVFLDSVKDGKYSYNQITTEVRSAVPIGQDGIVIYGKVNLNVNVDNAQKDMESVYVAVWRKEDQDWRLVAHQTALIKK